MQPVMLRLLRGNIIKVVYNKPKVQRLHSAQYNRSANHIYCDI